VCLGCSLSDGTRSRREQWHNPLPAPGAAEVGAVEMRDLAVAAIADDRGCEQGRRLMPGDARQEMLEPKREERRLGPGHAQGFGQRGREELIAARLPCLAVSVCPKPMPRSVADMARQLRIESVGPF